MRYLITLPYNPPFYTPWFNSENFFSSGMVVYDLEKHLFTADGEIWQEIEFDSL